MFRERGLRGDARVSASVFKENEFNFYAELQRNSIDGGRVFWLSLSCFFSFWIIPLLFLIELYGMEANYHCNFQKNKYFKGEDKYIIFILIEYFLLASVLDGISS
jgi:hypothetical protein